MPSGFEISTKRRYRRSQDMKNLPLPGNIGVIGGGYTGSNTNAIDYLTISTPSNALAFGVLTNVRRQLTATSNGTDNRGIFIGGYTTAIVGTIDYVTIPTTGNAIAFGALSVTRSDPAACSNGFNGRGLTGGGVATGPVYSTTIDYVIVMTTSNAAAFGVLTAGRRFLFASDNGINNRGVFAGGGIAANNNYNIIDYVTIPTAGNATDFGDLVAARSNASGTSNRTNNRGIFVGGAFDFTVGNASINYIDYITITTPGNAVASNCLSVNVASSSVSSNGTNDRAFIGLGTAVTTIVNTIEYVTISRLSNSIDFGDLTVAKNLAGTTSNA